MSRVPDRGDIVSLNLNPATGREIAKHRPVLVLSPARFNRATGMAVICPITSKPKDGPFEVWLTGGKTVGAVLPDLVRSVDWRMRGATLIEKASPSVVDEAVAKLVAIVGGG